MFNFKFTLFFLSFLFFSFSNIKCTQIQPQNKENLEFYQGIGEIEEFIHLIPQKNSLIAKTKNGIVSINLSNGEINWRFILQETEKIKYFLADEKWLFLVSNQKNIFMLNIMNGRILWQDYIEEIDLQNKKYSHNFGGYFSKESFLFYSKNYVERRDLKKGTIEWKKQLKSSQIQIQNVFWNEQENKLFLIANSIKDAKSNLVIQVSDLSNDQMEDVQLSFPLFANNKNSKNFILLENSVIFLDENLQRIGFINLKSPLGSPQYYSLSKSKIDLSTLDFSELKKIKSNHFALVFNSMQNQGKQLMMFFRMKNLQDSSIEFINSLDIEQDTTVVIAQNDNQDKFPNDLFVCQLSQYEKQLVVEVKKIGDSIETAEIMEYHTFTKSQTGRIINAFTIPRSVKKMKSSQKKVLWNTLVFFEDQKFVSLIEGKSLWQREEALSQIIKYKIIDSPIAKLPQKETFSQSMNIFYYKIMNDLNNFFNGKFAFLMPSNNFDALINEKKRQEEFGFHKIMVLISNSSQIFGFDTRRGIYDGIIWKHSLLEYDLMDIFTTNSNSNSNSNSNNKIYLVVAKSKKTSTLTGFLINPFNGEIIQQIQLNGFSPNSQFISLSLPTNNLKNSQKSTISSSIELVFVVNEDHSSWKIIPETEEALKAFQLNAHKLKFFSIVPEEHKVKGFGFEKKDDSDQFNIVLLWNKIFSSDEEILGYSTTSRGQFPQTLAGNQYFNPNLLAVSTYNHESAFIHLIDLESDSILGIFEYENVEKPFRIKISRECILSTYWSTKYKSYVVSTIRLEASDFSAKNYFRNKDGSKQNLLYSKEKERSIDFQQASFLLKPSTSTDIKITKSYKGITSKAILFGLSSGDILMLHEKFLDPSRPSLIELKEIEKQIQFELPPYLTFLPDQRPLYITKGNQIEMLRDIATKETKMESVSFVFAYGLDLFYTWVSPSGSFDILHNDFHFFILILSIFGLVITIWILRHFINNREIKSNWQ
ncbi:hypothetical protein M0811_08671 [Anaeramoeba ignava]|uniref:ER membrane protein complex subunit 1 n=1 Tax=Anaeramoeba ignava TaxID=1746090 RepID=A0A9Q0RAY1_ANAIG|nr:hypothetical protein M0811_08671 [Anaeramoeba ignava]